MWVPVASCGVFASAFVIRAPSFVNGSTTWVALLKVITASCWPGLRRAANVRAACMAPAMGLPAMLSDASMTRMTPKLPPAVPGA